MFIKSLIVIFLSLFFYSCFPLSIDKLVEVDENEDWLYIGGDPAKTNISKSDSNLVPPFGLSWIFDADGGMAKNSLSISDAILFANTLNGEFYAIDVTSGKSLGRTSTLGKSSYSTPLIFRNNVVITSTNEKQSKIFSYNLIRGTIQWQRNVSWMESSPILINEDILMSSVNGKLYKLNVKTGNIIWTTRPADRKNFINSFHTSPTVHANIVFLGNTSGNLYAFDLTSGKELWKFETKGSIFCDASAQDGKIYFGSDDQNFYCIDTLGNLIWKKNLNTKFLSASTFYKDLVITGGIDGNIYAMDIHHGDVKWQFKTKGPIWASPLLQGSKIFIGSFDKNFYCLNAEDGKLLWNYLCEGRIRTSAVIWKNYIFAASDDKYIYCFK